MKEDETDSKVNFRKKSGKKKKDKLSGLSEHLKKKKHQLDWSSIKIFAKDHWNRRSKEPYFIIKHKDKAPLLNKRKRMPDNFKYLENDSIVLWKFLTQGKEVSKTFGRIKIGCVLESNLQIQKDYLTLKLHFKP